jgi:hypothetical protein
MVLLDPTREIALDPVNFGLEAALDRVRVPVEVLDGIERELLSFRGLGHGTLGRRRDRGSKDQADCSAPWNKWGDPEDDRHAACGALLAGGEPFMPRKAEESA